MRRSTPLAFFATLLLAGVALADVFCTSPVASTTITAGKRATISWDDNGKAPSLTALGTISIGLYTGSQFQQTLLKDLGSVDANKKALSVTIDPAIGPSGNFYFLRFRSTASKDPSDDQYSAKFTIRGATGKFDDSILQQISGAASGTAAGSGSASPARATAASAANTTASSSSIGLALSTPASSSAHPSASANSTSAAPISIPIPAMTGSGSAFAILSTAVLIGTATLLL